VSDGIRITADVDELASVRRFVRSKAAESEAPLDCLDDLVQAVDEAVTNTIEHGYRGGPGWIDVSVAFQDGDFVVTIEDGAPPFDPTAAVEPDLSVPPMARVPGGMGIHLIREATDAMTYRPRHGGGNILMLTRARGQARNEGGLDGAEDNGR
jgi:serine/threonine-protein kinase RsbW